MERHVNLIFHELLGELADAESETDGGSDEFYNYLYFVFVSH